MSRAAALVRWSVLTLSLAVCACGAPGEGPVPPPPPPQDEAVVDEPAPPTTPPPAEPPPADPPPADPPPPALDEVEPNGTPASANVVLGETTQWRGAIASAGDQDYLRLTLAVGETLHVTLSGPAATNYDLHLYSSSLVLLGASTGPDGSEQLRYVTTASAPMTVYLRVSGVGGASHADPYALGFTRTSTPATTVYLLRHAERADDSDDTPLLDPTGFARAQAWVDLLAPLQPGRLVVSNLQRTQQTLQPLATHLSLVPVVRPDVAPTVRGPTVQDSLALASELLEDHRGVVSVVCWHTPLLEDVARGLGVPAAQVPTWSHDSYDVLWVVEIPPTGPATLTVSSPAFPPLP